MNYSALLPQIVFLRWAVMVAAACWVAAFFHLPNPLRAYVPTYFGMTEIAPGIYTDDSRYADHILEAVQNGEMITESFFGSLEASPWMILCTTPDCDRTFATENRAFAYKDRFILVGHQGIHAQVIAHEMVHAELYREFRHSDNGPETVPAWLNEGLATYVSGDDRPTQFAASDALWVLEAEDLSDWHRLAHGRSWQDTYGAAQSLIANLDVNLGRDGLVDLIQSLHDEQLPQTTVQRAILGRIN